MQGLYAITPGTLDTHRLLRQVRSAIAGGASTVQYRGKQIPPALARTQALALRALTRACGTLFIVNDDSELAFSVEADGLHVGRDDGDAQAIAWSRQGWGRRFSPGSAPPFIIGVSCYNELQRAQDAVDAGADYIAFGSFFLSGTKPNAVRADLTLIGEAKARFGVPVVAIGGITVNNAHQLIAARADAIAVIGGLFDADDIEQRAREFTNLFKTGNHVHQKQSVI